MIAGPRTVELMICAPSSITTRPSMIESASTVPADVELDGLEHEAVALQQGLQLAGVLPPAVEHLVAHPVAVVDEPLDRVGDLELAAR